MRYKLCRCGGVRQDARGSVCAKCGAGKANKSRNTTEHGYDGAWKRLSLRKRTIDPLCEMCLRQGLAVPVDEVHHIVPIDVAPWLRLVWSNLMSVCNACHKGIHANVAHGVVG